MLAARAGRIAVSPTMKVAADAMRLKAQGIDVLDFGAGEPDFPTPVASSAAARRPRSTPSSRSTRPTRAPRTSSARSPHRYQEDYGVDYASRRRSSSRPEESKRSSTPSWRSSGPGDEVITHMPGWPTLVEQIKLAEATPVIVRTYAGRRLPAQRRTRSSTRSRRARAASSSTRRATRPGRSIDEADHGGHRRRGGAPRDLDPARPVLREADLRPGSTQPVAVLTSRMRDRVVFCGSASKAYAMTGWRCGWTMGPAAVIGACNALQSHSTSNACSITQRAVEAALNGPQYCVTDMLDEYRNRRDRLCEWLAAEPRLRLVKPAGAFYLFPDVSEFLSPDGIRTTAELARRCSTTHALRSRRAKRSTRPASSGSPTPHRWTCSSAALLASSSTCTRWSGRRSARL